MIEKSITEIIDNQLAIAEKVGCPACAFSREETLRIRETISQLVQAGRYYYSLLIDAEKEYGLGMDFGPDWEQHWQTLNKAIEKNDGQEGV